MGIKDKITLPLKSIPVISLGNYGLTFKSSVVKEIVSLRSRDSIHFFYAHILPIIYLFL